MTMTRSTARSAMMTTHMPSQLVEQPQQQEIRDVVRHTLQMMKTIEEESGVQFSPSDLVNQAFNHLRHLDIMQYKRESEVRQYIIENQREERVHQREQKHHDETMEAAREDRDWFDKIQAVRDSMYESLMNQALGALYLFFAMHVLWHVVRLRHVWSFSFFFAALQYSICGECMPDTTGFESQDPSSGLLGGYLAYFVPSWTTVSSYVGFDLHCTTICIGKCIFSVLWFMLAAMIIPVWMVKYISAAVIVLTMLANVLELVPFVMHWGYIGASYFLVWAFWSVYIWWACRKSQDTLKNCSTPDTTPSHEKVTNEKMHLSDLRDLFWLAHKFVIAAIIGCCVLCCALELERNG